MPTATSTWVITAIQLIAFTAMIVGVTVVFGGWVAVIWGAHTVFVIAIFLEWTALRGDTEHVPTSRL